MPLLSSIIAFPDGEDDVLSHDSRPPPDGAGLPRLRERRACWQVGTSIAHMFKSRKESCLRAAGFSSPACKDGGFQTRSSVSCSSSMENSTKVLCLYLGSGISEKDMVVCEDSFSMKKRNVQW
jgi:hypothetical protein